MPSSHGKDVSFLHVHPLCELCSSNIRNSKKKKKKKKKFVNEIYQVNLLGEFLIVVFLVFCF